MTEFNVISFPNRRRSEGPLALTVRLIEKLEPRAGRYSVPDATVRGLVVRVQPSGSKSFYVETRIGRGRAGQRINIRIGGVDEIRLADARERARDVMLKARGGKDPTIRTRTGERLAELIELYDRDLVRREVQKRRDVMSSLRRNFASLKRVKGEDLERASIVAIIDRIEDEGRPGAAAYFRQCANSFLNWAADTGHLRANVLAGYRRGRTTRAQRLSRELLTLIGRDELRAFWQATEKGSAQSRDFFRLCLLTGQRKSETNSMRWSDVSGAEWVIPAHETKMGRTQRVPLGPMSRALIEAQPRRAGTDLVFPGRMNPDGTMGRMTGMGERWRAIKARLVGLLGEFDPARAPGMDKIGCHALRRSFRTGLSEVGVAFEVAEAMIAHKRGDLVARYDKSELWAERQAAQLRWEAHLTEVLK